MVTSLQGDGIRRLKIRVLFFGCLAPTVACPVSRYNPAHASMPVTSGATLGSYETISLVGVGGMGEVYKARDTRLDRIVAVKILSQHVTAANADNENRFEREARAICSLQHPHICVLYDIGFDAATGADYLVMEYLEGETLAKRLERGALLTDQLLKVATEVADSLDRAHRQGIPMASHWWLRPRTNKVNSILCNFPSTETAR